MSELQAFIDGMNAQLQRERADEQLTIGEMIRLLEAMPYGAEVEGLGDLYSYRGYYCDLAFEPIPGKKLATDLLDTCRAAIWQSFEGYKGGNYVMDDSTPLWLADYGCCGDKIIGINSDGTIETAADDL